MLTLLQRHLPALGTLITETVTEHREDRICQSLETMQLKG